MRWTCLLLFGLLIPCLVFNSGCGNDGNRVVEETSEYSFDDVAEQAARETEESEAASENAE